MPEYEAAIELKRVDESSPKFEFLLEHVNSITANTHRRSFSLMSPAGGAGTLGRQSTFSHRPGLCPGKLRRAGAEPAGPGLRGGRAEP